MSRSATATLVAPSPAPREEPLAPAVPSTEVSAAIRWQRSLTVALGEARRTGRLVMLAFGTDRSPYCRRMEQESFTSPKVIALSRHLVCVKADVATAYGKSLADRYAVAAIPSMLFLEASGLVLRRRDGFQMAAALARLLREVAPEEIQWQGSLAGALRESCGAGLPVMLAFEADWWPYSRRMAWETYADDQVIALSRCFLCTKVDAGSDAGRELRRQYSVETFPSVILFDASGQVAQRCEGFCPAADMAAAMQSVLDR